MTGKFSKSQHWKFLFPMILLFLFGICSCGGIFPGIDSAENIEKTIQFVATQYTPEALISSATMVVLASSTATPRPSLTPTNTQAFCSQQQGKIEFREILTDLSAHPIAFRVYLPPCYEFQSGEDYPVLYLLHGQGYKDDQWVRLGIVETADQLISTEEIPPLIIVMPWEIDSLQDDKLSIFDEILIDELVPWVDEAYRTCVRRECRAIGGISRGAAWAMRLGFTEWSLFSAVGAHSFAPFPGDFYNVPIWLRDIPEDELPDIYMDMGYLDYMLEPAGLFEDRLTDYAVPHAWIINEGTHNEDYWGAHIEDYLRWYTFRWK